MSEPKAAVLQRLQAMQAEGLSLQKIADRLNHEGVPTLSGKGRWQKGTIGQSAGAGRRGLMKVREIIALVEADGWYLVRTRGDHRQYKHPTKPGRVTVSGHRNDDIHPKTLTSILTQAGLRGRNP